MTDRADFYSDGGECKYKVLLYALCSDGEVYPLFYDNWYVRDSCMISQCHVRWLSEVLGVDVQEIADGECRSGVLIRFGSVSLLPGI